MPTQKLTRVQQYKLRKRKQQQVALLLSVIVIALTLIALTCTNKVELREESYIVSRGDTLWNLYSEHCAGVKWGTWLHEMLTINDLGNDPVLMTGDNITLLVTD